MACNYADLSELRNHRTIDFLNSNFPIILCRENVYFDDLILFSSGKFLLFVWKHSVCQTSWWKPTVANSTSYRMFLSLWIKIANIRKTIFLKKKKSVIIVRKPGSISWNCVVKWNRRRDFESLRNSSMK